MKRSLYAFIFSLLLPAILSCCATGGPGVTPETTITAMCTEPGLMNSEENIYCFVIQVAGASEAHVVDQRVVSEIKKYMDHKGFGRYKILQRTDQCDRFIYTVQFSW